MISRSTHSSPELRAEFKEFCKHKGKAKYAFYDRENCALAQFGKQRENLQEGERVLAGATYYMVVDATGKFLRDVRVFNYDTDNENLRALVGNDSFAQLAEELVP